MSALEHLGPVYPDLPAVKKHRSLARKGLAVLTREQRQAYGAAVETAIRAKQRSELQRELPSHRCRCASGTDYSEGADIDAAVKRQHRARTQSWASQIRRARTPQQWQEMYEEAMAEKRARDSQTLKEAA